MSRPPVLPIHLMERLTVWWGLVTALLAILLALLVIGALQAAGLISSHPVIPGRPIYLLGFVVTCLAIGWAVVPRVLRIARRMPLYTLDHHGLTDHRSGSTVEWSRLGKMICDEMCGHVLISLEQVDSPPTGPARQLVYISGWNIDIPTPVLERLIGTLIDKQELAA